MKHVFGRKNYASSAAFTLTIFLFVMGFNTSASEPAYQMNDLNSGKGERYIDELHLTCSQIDSSAFPQVDMIVLVTDESDEPVLGLDESHFDVTEDGVAEDFDLTEIQPNEGIAVALAIDVSGSMAGLPLENAKAAAHEFVDQMGALDRVAIVAFESYAYVAQEFTGDKALLHTAIDELYADGSTALFDGICLGLEEASGEVGVKAVIAFSDGEENVSVDCYGEDEPHYSPVCDLAIQYGIPVYTIKIDAKKGPAALKSDDWKAGRDPASKDDDLEEIADCSNGEYYTGSSADLGEIYVQIASGIQESYRIRYVSHNQNVPPITRSVTTTVTYQGLSDSFTTHYSAGNAPCIQRTEDTIALGETAQPSLIPITIAAYITDDEAVSAAHLYYRETGSDGHYTEAEMSNESGDLYSYTIGGGYVLDPGVDYYITAEDGTYISSDPANNPGSAPYQIAVLPNEAPVIVHEPVNASEKNVAVEITAEAFDETNYVENVMLYVREKGDFFYDEMEMSLNAGAYRGAIPASYTQGVCVEYYIKASDDYGTCTYHGTDENPHQIRLLQEDEMQIGLLVIRADNFENISGEHWRATGNIMVSDYIRIDGALDFDYAEMRIWSDSITISLIDVPLLGEVPLFSGELEINAETAGFSDTFENVVNMFFPAGMEFKLQDIRIHLNEDFTFESVEIRGKIILPEYLGGAELDFSNENYILISIAAGVEFKGDICIESLRFDPYSGWELQDICVAYDPHGECGGMFDVPSITAGARLILPVLNIEGAAGICDSKLDWACAELSGIQIPIASPPVFYVTAIGACVMNIMPEPPPLRLEGWVDLTGGTPVPIGDNQSLYLLQLNGVTLIIDLGGLVGLEGDFGIFIPENPPWHIEVGALGINLFEYDFEGIDLASGGAYINVNEGFNGWAEIAFPQENPLLEAHADLAVDWNLIFSGSAFGAVNLPHIPPFDPQTVAFNGAIDNESISGSVNLGVAELSVRFFRSGDIEFYTNFNFFDMQKFEYVPGTNLLADQTFYVPPGYDLVMFLTKWEKGDTDITLVTPSGETVIPEYAPMTSKKWNYFKPDNRKQAAYFIKNPQPGNWQVSLTDPDEIGEAVTEMYLANSKPTIELHKPDVDLHDPETIVVEWFAFDPDDDAEITIYRGSVLGDCQGTAIAESIEEVEGIDSIEIDVTDWPSGKYFINAKIDDGKNSPCFSHSTAQIIVRNQSAHSEPQDFRVTASESSVHLYWSPPASTGDDPNIGYRIFYTDRLESSAYDRSIAVGNKTSYIIDNLTPGRAYKFAIAAYDSSGKSGGKSDAVIRLISDENNNDPWILSSPIRKTRENERYVYTVSAYDMDGDELSYELVEAPEGMTITEEGQIEWTPYNNRIGNNSVILKVGDGNGGETIQEFTINVTHLYGKNMPPQFSSLPLCAYLSGKEYLYEAVAKDPERDSIEYELIRSPEGMEIDPLSGAVNWLPDADENGCHDVILKAIDNTGKSCFQHFTLTCCEPDIGAYVHLNKDWFVEGDTMDVSLCLKNEGETKTVNLYFALQAFGEFYFLDPTSNFYPDFSETPIPFTFTIDSGFSQDINLFAIPLAFDLPFAECEWCACMTDTDTGELYGDYSIFPFTLHP